MKKTRIGIVVVLLLSLISVGTKSINAASVYCTGSSGYQYCVTPTALAPKSTPVYETQTQHTYGYTTTISMNTSSTSTMSYSGSLSFSFNTGFVLASSTVTAGVGVTTSESHTISYTTSYSISPTTASGKYRIEHVFPNYKLLYASYTDEGAKVQTSTKTDIPGNNESYKRLWRYAN